MAKRNDVIKAGINQQGEGYKEKPCIFLNKTMQISDGSNNSLILYTDI